MLGPHLQDICKLVEFILAQWVILSGYHVLQFFICDSHVIKKLAEAFNLISFLQADIKLWKFLFQIQKRLFRLQVAVYVPFNVKIRVELFDLVLEILP